MTNSTDETPWTFHKCMCGDPACDQYTLSRQGSVGFSRDDAEAICDAMNQITRYPSGGKISREELAGMFGEKMPIVAAKILWAENSTPLTTAEVRTLLRALAASQGGSEKCFEVREGYAIDVWVKTERRGLVERPLSEALTIRTVDDVRQEAFKEQLTEWLPDAVNKWKEEVRREALEEAANLIAGQEHVDSELRMGRLQAAKILLRAYEAIIALIDAPAPSRETPPVLAVTKDMIEAAFKKLPADAWGTIACGEMERVLEAALKASAPQPTPSPEPVAWRARHSETEKWHLFEYHPSWWEVQPLYASPPTTTTTTTPQPDELRRAKYVAWEQGVHDMKFWGRLAKNPYAAPDEGGNDE